MALPVHLVNRILMTTKVLRELDKLSADFLKIPDKMTIRHKESIRRLTGSTDLKVLMTYDNWMTLLKGIITILDRIPLYYPEVRQDIKDKYIRCLQIFCECQLRGF